MPQDKIDRAVLIAHAQPFDPQDTIHNNTWVYRRAPDGYLYQLIEIVVSGKQEDSNKYGICALFDGHEYTHYNLWPGVESRELLWRGQMNDYVLNIGGNLHGWECKEFTMGIRSTHETFPYKVTAVIWYFLKKASREELLEYAVKHPFNPDAFKRSLRGTTVDTEELTPHG